MILEETNYESLYEDFFEKLVNYATKIVKDKEVSRDIVQEIFVSVWNKKEDILNLKRIDVYLYRSVHYRCVNYIREDKVKAKYIERAANDINHAQAVYQVDESEVIKVMKTIITELPNRTRKVITLKMSGLKIHQISEDLNISQNTVKTHVAIAYKRIRKKLKAINI